MTKKRAEKFAIKVLPPYFFKNQTLDSLVVHDTSTEFQSRLVSVLPRLKLNPEIKAKSGLLIQDRYKSKQVTLNEITAVVRELETSGVMFIVSHRDWGVKTLLRSLRQCFGQEQVEILERGMAGFRLICIKITDAQKAQISDTHTNVNINVKTASGKNLDFSLLSNQSLFSAYKLDSGTNLILETIEFEKYKRILDIGCGWGAIGITALMANPQALVVMTDINPSAVEVVQANLKNQLLEERGRVIATAHPAQLQDEFDLVVSHPPYHLSNQELYELFAEAKTKLSKGGVMVLGTDKTYRNKFTKLFTDLGLKTKLLAEKNQYLVIQGV